MKRTCLVIALLGAFSLSWMPPARADLISIGLQESGVLGGAITTVASGSGIAGILGTSYGSFTLNSITAQDTATLGTPDLLFSNSLDTSSKKAGTLSVWITAQGLTQPLGLANVISSFTSNGLPQNWTVKETTYFDAANGRYATTTPLSSATFTTIGTSVGNRIVDFAGPFSITQLYTITTTGKGTANSTINISIPEPGSFFLLGFALIGLGIVVARSRRRRAG